MFIVTTKLTRKKLISAVIATGLLLCAFILWASNTESNITEAAARDPAVKAIKSNDDRLAFLSTYGWDADPQPTAAEEVRIPEEFDGVFSKYNEIQTGQGFDLEKHKGRRVKKYTYEIKNYPTGEPGVLANILVYKDEIIGGDISSPVSGGFIHGFAKP